MQDILRRAAYYPHFFDKVSYKIYLIISIKLCVTANIHPNCSVSNLGAVRIYLVLLAYYLYKYSIASRVIHAFTFFR